MMSDKVEVWDLSTRIFHWALVVCVTGSYVSVEIFEDLDWHQNFGLTIFALLVFRIAWGFVGSTTARFTSFVRGPRAALAHLVALRRGTALKYTGHNPLGAFSVVAMVLILLTQVGLGLFSNDDLLWDGPLAPLISKGLSNSLTELHKINFNLLFALILIHVAAALIYLCRGENLIVPMITGVKRSEETGEPPPERLRFPRRRRALALCLMAAMVVYGVLQLS